MLRFLWLPVYAVTAGLIVFGSSASFAPGRLLAGGRP